MHYELNYGVPAIAVGLSAISLLASFSSRSKNPVPNSRPRPLTSFPFPLAKDAAPIPNAFGATNT